jgi:cytidylate kinase
LSQTLGWPLRDASQIFRDISMQAGHDLEKSPQQYAAEIDKQVDDKTLAVLKENHRLVVTSKLVGFLSRDVKHTLRVLITCPTEERIRRYARSRGHSLLQAKELMILRENKDQEKWRRLYGDHDFFNPKYFQLALDSSLLSPQGEVEQILAYLL